MVDKFLPKLSQNLLEMLDDDEYYDVTIEVGNDPYVKIFRAHMNILNYRSPYLRRIFSTNKKKNEGNLTHIKLSNISQEVFQIILRYIYGGRLSLGEYDASDIVKILVAANELSLKELIDYLQSSLIENKATWMEQNIDLIYKTSFDNVAFLELQKYCTELISKEPEKIFKSPNFSLIPENLLILLIQCDIIQMTEIQIWEHVLKWGLAQNSELPSDPTSYSKDDFNVLKNTLQRCIPFIRFHDLNSKEFLDKVLPYKKALPKELYKDLIKYFLDPISNSSDQSNFQITEETKGTSDDKEVQEPQTIKETKEVQAETRMAKEAKEAKEVHQVIKEAKEVHQVINETKEVQAESHMAKEAKEIRTGPPMTRENKEFKSEPLMNNEEKRYIFRPNDKVFQTNREITSLDIDSKIISNQHVELISRWIDKIDVSYTSMFSGWVWYKPNYEFKLLFRGSRDGFMPSNFHKICDNQFSTVIIIKVKDSDEILGGYNPIEWRPDYHYGTTKDSFIFSFEDKDKINNYILSRVIDDKHAITNESYCGPSFGKGDLILREFGFSNSNVYCSSSQVSYEYPIRKIEDVSSVEEYEVFQIMRN